MQQPPTKAAPTLTAPTFHLTVRQPLSPLSIFLAIVAAVAALSVILFAMDHTGHHLLPGDATATRTPTPTTRPPGNDDDDPNQIDTIVLGDPADAPVPARKGDHVSPVHPTILVQLPRYGPQTGLIPDTPAGHLLYRWLAAFNQADYPALANALPTIAPTPSARAQMDLRQQTGGFNLLSAKEVQPGILVFRLRDQTPAAIETLGTLQLRPNATPAAIATFSLRAIPPTP